MIITGSPANDNASIQEVEVRSGALSTTSPYQDLGAVVDTTNMAAGATVWSNWYDGIQWVRNIVLMAQSDQQYDIGVNKRDTSGTIDNTQWYSVNQSAVTGTWRPNIQTPSTSTAASGIVGYSARFGIKNSSASPNTFGKLRVQLMGA